MINILNLMRVGAFWEKRENRMTIFMPVSEARARGIAKVFLCLGIGLIIGGIGIDMTTFVLSLFSG